MNSFKKRFNFRLCYLNIAITTKVICKGSFCSLKSLVNYNSNSKCQKCTANSILVCTCLWIVTNYFYTG